MNIGFDIDGVLTDFERYVIEYGQEFLNKIPVNRAGSDISEIFAVDMDTEDYFWKNKILEYATSYKTRPYTEKIIKKLKNEGHQIFIITNRCTDLSYCDISVEQMKVYVQEWLKRENIEYDKIIFNSVKSKLPVCLEHKIDVMIEDDLEHIKELMPHLQTICFKSSYNTKKVFENCIYVSSMPEVYEIICKIKV